MSDYLENPKDLIRNLIYYKSLLEFNLDNNTISNGPSSDGNIKFGNINGERVCIKCIKNDRYEDEEGYYRNLVNEIINIRCIEQNANVVKCLGITKDDHKIPPHGSDLLTEEVLIKIGKCAFSYHREIDKDPVTQIYSRWYLRNYMGKLFKRAKETKSNLWILFLDLNDFSSINKQNDHDTGDYCLKEFARLIQSNHVRSGDIFARYGGDEFVLLLKEVNHKLATEIANGISVSVENHAFKYNGRSLRVTVSIGNAELSQSIESIKDWIKLADKSLLDAKKKKENLGVSIDFEDSKYKMNFPKGISLLNVRKLLEDKYEKQKKGPDMRSNCFFYDFKYGIVIDEDKTKLECILNNNNSIKIVVDTEKPDWTKLIQECECAFIPSKKGTFRATMGKKALRIKFKKLSCREFPGLTESKYHCQSHFDHLYVRNLVAELDLKNLLSNFPQINHDKLFETSQLSKTYNIVERQIAYIEFSEQDITISQEFMKEIENALSDELTIQTQYENLEKLKEEYGHFYAKKVTFGGKIVEQIGDSPTSTVEYRNIIGGCVKSYYNNKIPGWLDSLENTKNWKIIEYENISSIFDLLSDNDPTQ
ncbi:5267_t:CDS:2, partial [Acaulospora morrowiae]